MKNVVITGSSRGIGKGLAESFLNLGCNVIISGRNPVHFQNTISELSEKFGEEKVFGCLCDVRDYNQVLDLWNQSKNHFGSVDIWVNNAGVGHPRQKFWDQNPELYKTIINTNIIGTMNGAKVAITGMLEQGHGAIYNMEGLGSDGRKVDGLTLYGSSKNPIRYFTESLAKEVKNTGLIIGAFSPGMVLTDFLTGNYEEDSPEWEQAKKIFNILADRVESVTPWLAEKALSNKKNGARFDWMTIPKTIWRFISAPITKRNIFD